MIPKGLFTQILLLIVAVTIVLTYIKPAFSSIGETQDKIVRYQSERGKVQEVNTELKEKLEKMESISATDHRKLLVYMPDQVDSMSVMRTLRSMSEESGLIFNDVISELQSDTPTRPSRRGSTEVVEEDDNGTKVYKNTFTLNVTGSYNQIKTLVDKLEQNEYPLELHGLSIAASEGGFLDADMSIITYSHLTPVKSETLYE